MPSHIIAGVIAEIWGGQLSNTFCGKLKFIETIVKRKKEEQLRREPYSLFSCTKQHILDAQLVNKFLAFYGLRRYMILFRTVRRTSIVFWNSPDSVSYLFRLSLTLSLLPFCFASLVISCLEIFYWNFLIFSFFSALFIFHSFTVINVVFKSTICNIRLRVNKSKSFHLENHLLCHNHLPSERCVNDYWIILT